MVALDNQPVRSAQELQRRLPKAVGASVSLRVVRGGQRLNLAATTVAGQLIEALEEQA
jgi:S1-C subfamily serine protease